MAGFVVSPNTLRVLIHWTFDGRPQLNVTHMLYTPAGPLNPNIAQTIYAPVQAAFVAANGMNTLTASVLDLVGVGVVDLRGEGFPEIPSTGTSVSGQGPGAPMPEQVSACVTLRTARTGRSRRGRMYLFGWVPGAMSSTGLISDATSAAALAFVTAIQQGCAAAGGQMAIRSPELPSRPTKPGGTLDPKPFEINPVTAIVMRDRIWDTNRRRQDLIRR